MKLQHEKLTSYQPQIKFNKVGEQQITEKKYAQGIDIRFSEINDPKTRSVIIKIEIG